jgi:chromosome segregation ATPase
MASSITSTTFKVMDSSAADSSMENFIKHQMMAILQPFADHVQELDAHVTKLAEDLCQTDTNVAANTKGLETTNASVLELRNGLKKTNARLTTVREGLESCNQAKEHLQQGLESTNSNMQKINNSLESTIGAVQELQRGLKEADSDISMLQNGLKQTNDQIANQVLKELDNTNLKVSELTTSQVNYNSNFEMLKFEVEMKTQFLQETRHGLEKNNVRTTALQKQLDELQKLEEALSAKLQDTCHHLTKTQRGLQATDTDVAKLKEGLESNDAATHILQQGHATWTQNLTNLSRAHDKSVFDIEFLKKELTLSQQKLYDTSNQLGKTTALAYDLQSGLHETNSNLCKTTLQADALDLKTNQITADLLKTSNSLGDVTKSHTKNLSHVQTIQH